MESTTSRRFETGMYVIDHTYRIVNCNAAMRELYPDVKTGDICYRAIALRETPCEICPLRVDNALFYNPERREWIYANAAAMDYPGHGACFNIQFQLRQKIMDAAQETPGEENMDEHIMELSGGDAKACAIGGYCEPGSPLFFASASLISLLGYENMDDLYRDVDGLVSNTIHPDDVEHVTRDLTKCAQMGGTFETTYRIRHKDHTWSWIVSRGKRVQTGNGSFALLCVISDMSDFIRRQDQLHEENEKLLKRELTDRAVLEHMPGGYHRCADAYGFPFLYVGESFEKITGWTRGELETEFDGLFINMVLPEDVSRCTGIIDNIEKNGYSNDIYRIKSKGGGHRWVSDSTMRVEIGDEVFYHGVLADVTDYVEGMERQRQIAEDSSRAKSTFLFNVSHDIRTPLNAIRGFTHMIGENPADTVFVTDAVEKIKKSSAVLLQLLNDVLELSRIESGKDKPEATPESLPALAEHLYLMFAGEIGELGIRFRMENDIRHPFVSCDELKCTRILMNMLSNAKKFTPAGGEVVFGITELSSDESTATYRLYTRDTGIGMSHEFQARAFEEFERVKSSTDSGKTGSGLGLSIIKRLCDLMGGTCELSSEPGVGTEIAVVLTFPLCTESEVRKRPVPTHAMDHTGRRVLVVEDNDFNREIARYVFSNIGFTVEEAENGQVCLDMLLAADPERYDLILMDIQMPVMDGYAATAAIRALDDRKRASIPIVAMTANAFKEDKAKCLAVGMNGHIGKPFEAAEVMEVLSSVL